MNIQMKDHLPGKITPTFSKLKNTLYCNLFSYFQSYYGYKIQNMMYPFNESTIRPSKPAKKRKIKKGSLFFSKSKPFAVSSESFQYEHGSQYEENSYRMYSHDGVSTLKRASIGTDTDYGVNRRDFSPLQKTLKSKSGRKYLSTLSDSQFRFLYGSPRGSCTDSNINSLNPSYSDNLGENYFETRKESAGRQAMAVASEQGENIRVYSNPPILVSSGTFVRHNAPEATNLHMIYTDEDYSKVYQREHKAIANAQAMVNPQRCQETSSRERKVFRHEDNPRKTQHSERHCNATGSYSTQVQFLNSSGKLVSYRVIRPKVTGAPVSVMVD